MINNRQSEILIINPLSSALKHYQLELEQTLTSAGSKVECISFDEPSSNGGKRLRWIRSYVAALISARRRKPDSVVILWPVLGYLDFCIMSFLGMRNTKIVIHDPHPLVRAIGYGRFARAFARRGSKALAITHSTKAQLEVASQLGNSRVRRIPHPILTPEPDEHSPQRAKTIRVLGQYKKSRDLAALELLAKDPLLAAYEFEIVGRGWPKVRGWHVRAEFVAEEELDFLIKDSAGIVIPYTRFYQSGVAIRALENLTPIVGPSGTSLEDVYGKNAGNLVTNDWVATTIFAVGEAKSDIATTRAKYIEYVTATAGLYE